MVNIEAKIKQFKEEISILIKQSKENIKNLPDNPKIKRLNSNCFTINKNDLDDNLSPYYYDFKYQYKMIVDNLNVPNEKFIEKLDKIILEKRVKYPGTGRYGSNIYEKLNPIVGTHLEKLRKL